MNVAAAPPASVCRPAWPATAVAVAGMLALLARPAAVPTVAHPVAFLVVVFAGLGLAGGRWPLPRPAGPPAAALSVPAAMAVGVGAMVAARVLAGGPAAAPLAAVPLALNTLAAVAEEAFFRRLVYGLLAPWGAAVAVTGSAAAFALVHVTVWGPALLPVDLAAGLLLSWQRAATGHWLVPAATHTVANLLVAL